MHNPKLNLFSHLILVASLLAGLFFSGRAAARPVEMKDTAARPSSTGLLMPALASNLLTIPALPVGVGSPTVNGTCNKTEYSGGLFVTFPDGPNGKGTGNLYLIHDASSLFMCITSPLGTYPTRFDSIRRATALPIPTPSRMIFPCDSISPAKEPPSAATG